MPELVKHKGCFHTVCKAWCKIEKQHNPYRFVCAGWCAIVSHSSKLLKLKKPHHKIVRQPDAETGIMLALEKPTFLRHQL